MPKFIKIKSHLILAQLFRDLLKLILGDVAIVVLVEDLEGHLGLVGGLTSAGHRVLAFFHLAQNTNLLNVQMR